MASRNKVHRREAQLDFESISIEGALLSPDWLCRAAQLTAGGQGESDYRIPKGLVLRDEIGRFWRIAQAHWHDFAAGRRAGAEPNALAERFVRSLLSDCFGFTSILVAAPQVIAERGYPIGFSALGGRVPVVIAPAGIGLDTLAPAFGDAGRRRSAFGLAQEFLNAEERALWGIACDGVELRIVRDHASLTRPAWIEADLGRIFTEDRYADFAAVWLICHESRFGRPDQPVTECSLEAWRDSGREEGTRARDLLRQGVELALGALGEGFLNHPDNQSLRAALQNGTLSTKDYFNQLLRLVYRLIFMLTVEERGLLHPEGTSDAARSLYAAGYGLRRLRTRSVKRSAHDRHGDLWEGVKIVFRGLANGEPRLGLPALAGMFARTQCPAIDDSKLENRSLLLVMFRLSWLREASGLARVNWRDMGPEELGSVYESLLELTPEVRLGGRSFGFAQAEGGQHARRATGSYYTPENLVRLLLDRTLNPIIESVVRANPERPADALLELAIVDPTCGSGHFLLAAARRLAAAIARCDAQGTPTAAEYRHALRRVVSRCLFGVDLNPLAIELCKVSLWMEAVEPGRPLSFLDSHIQHGNALLGASPAWMEHGVPDAAWEPVDGDDKKTATALKKRNQRASDGQRVLDTLWPRPVEHTDQSVTRAVAELEANSDADAAAVEDKKSKWDGILDTTEYRRNKLVADAWCASFVWPKQPGELADCAPTSELWRQLRDAQGEAPELAVKTTAELANQYHFFHWHLGFPQIFARGGFDVVLGNPPWIAHAGRAAQPLAPSVKKFCKANYSTFAGYPTTHGMFIARAAQLLREGGAVGIIVPSSVSELPKYEPTRRAHDELCDVPDVLVDFGEGQFPGVTQPCMALVSKRVAGGRQGAEPGAPWPMERPDLDDVGRALLARLAELPPLPRELFGERGFQSDASAQDHFLEATEAQGRFTLALREGTYVREFQLLAPRTYADPIALAGKLRGPEEYEAVRFVVRNTARYPIAALSDGKGFRNSLLAGFDSEEWPAAALVALLNSSLIRWQHYMRFRDARQPVMPQVKIGHLRSIPQPLQQSMASIGILKSIGERLSLTNAALSPSDRSELDTAVFTFYGVDARTQDLVTEWHRRIHESSGRRAAKAQATSTSCSTTSPQVLPVGEEVYANLPSLS
jgi:hypothetical protein